MHPTWSTAPPTLMTQSREVLYRCGLLVRWFIMRVFTTSTGLEATAAQKLATALDLQGSQLSTAPGHTPTAAPLT